MAKRIPGPASKTRPFRNNPSGSAMDQWSFVPTPSSSQAQGNMMTSGPPSPPLIPAKLTCLFCADLFSPEEEDLRSREKLVCVLKVLYYHFQVPFEFPQEDVARMFPFCKLCKARNMSIYEDQKKIQELQRRISRNKDDIERMVADQEILGQFKEVKQELNEPNKFVKTILEGYRNKLRVKRKLREYLYMGINSGRVLESVCSHTSIIRDAQISKQFREARQTHPIISSKNEGDKDAGSDSSLDIGEEASYMAVGNSAGHHPLTGGRDGHGNGGRVGDDDIAQLDDFIGEYDENSCTMIIKNVRSGNGSCDMAHSSSSELEASETVLVKSEPFHSSPDGKFQSPKRSPFELINRGSLSSTEAVAAVSAFHSSEPGPSSRMYRSFMERPKRSYWFSCKNCNGKFRTKNTLREHIKQFHSAPKRHKAPKTNGQSQSTSSWQDSSIMEATRHLVSPVLECDICGRPVRGSFINLMAHKFSHKNDEERKEAVERGELGARSSLLSRNGVNMNKPKSQATAVGFATGRRYRKRRGRKGKANLNSKPMSESGDKPFKCPSCPRSFQKKNNLALHYKTHRSQQSKTKAIMHQRQGVGVSSSAVAATTVEAPLANEGPRVPSLIFGRVESGVPVVIGERLTSGQDLPVNSHWEGRGTEEAAGNEGGESMETNAD